MEEQPEPDLVNEEERDEPGREEREGAWRNALKLDIPFGVYIFWRAYITRKSVKWGL